MARSRRKAREALSRLSPTFAIVGRPNVGKSTLFNRLVGRGVALVDNQPGVTRDYREGEAHLGGLSFKVIDTAGLDRAGPDELSGSIRKATEQALSAADACMFLVDAKSGVLPPDREIADFLRRQSKPVILVANKSDGRAGDTGYHDAFELGFGEPVRLSAAHGDGLSDLFMEMQRTAEELAARPEAADPGLEPVGDDDGDALESPIRIAVVGRPNSGKSSLINKVLGHERLLTGAAPGITRDAVSVSADWNGLPVEIFDTAGMRKRARVVEKVERMSVADGLRAVRFAEVVVVLLDAAKPFESQDLRIADLAEREGRAVVVALNKWDLVDDKERRLQELKRDFEFALPQLKGGSLAAVSALTGFGLDGLCHDIHEAHRRWRLRISTGILNRWLEEAVEAHPPPAPGGRRIRLRYMTQAKSRPPTFVVMCSYPRKLPESYSRYLSNGLRAEFGLGGTPIRLHFRSRPERNPFSTHA